MLAKASYVIGVPLFTVLALIPVGLMILLWLILGTALLVEGLFLSLLIAF